MTRLFDNGRDGRWNLVDTLVGGSPNVGVDDEGASVSGSLRFDTSTTLRSTQQLNVDWSSFAEHVFFSSAQVVVNVAFDRIINGFPFDGTRADIDEFLDSLTGFEKWVFDRFPKHVGSLHFSGSSGSYPGVRLTIVDSAGSSAPTLSSHVDGASALSPSGSFTVEAFVYPAQHPGEAILVQQYDASQPAGYTIALSSSVGSSSSRVMFAVSSGQNTVTASTSIPIGAFSHLACVHDDDAASAFVYVDGVLAASSSFAELDGMSLSSAPLTIGSGSAHGTLLTPTTTFSGALDELRLWHTARTASQIRGNMHVNVFAPDDLKLYYRFNEPTGSLSQSSTLDRIVLDHTGRFHAYIPDDVYDQALRSPSWAPSPLRREKPEDNPVLFPASQGVVDLNTSLLTDAAEYDAVNPNLITRLVPPHYFLEGQVFEGLTTEEGTIVDTYAGDAPRSGSLGTAQLLSSFLYSLARTFDDVKLYLDSFGELFDVDRTPSGLVKRIAHILGVELPPLFSGVTARQFVDRSATSDGLVEIALQRIQNEVWRRLLTEYSTIIREKGTLRSISSFMRAVGVEPNTMFRVREYGGPHLSDVTSRREERVRVRPILDFSRIATGSYVLGVFLTGSRVEPGWPFPAGTSSDILLTSGSWTLEGHYTFPSTTRHDQVQSLMRLATTGSLFDGGDAIVANVVVVSGSGVTPSSLTLYARPEPGGPVVSASIPVNMFDDADWRVAFGFRRFDDVYAGTVVSSSMWMYAGRQSMGVFTDEHIVEVPVVPTWTTLSTLTGSFNASGSYFVIGERTTSTDTTYTLTSASHLVTSFDGRVSNVRFWSKWLSRAELREHTMNTFGAGVDDPNVNYNFVTSLTGSWNRLRVDIPIAQDVTGLTTGILTLTDTSQASRDCTLVTAPTTSSILTPHVYVYTVPSMRFDERVTNEKVKSLSFVTSSNIELYGGLQGPVYEPVPAGALTFDGGDRRLSVDISPTDALNDDIAGMFRALDELDNALGGVETLFSEDYSSLQHLREVYFQRLTDRVNLRAFVDFFRWFDSSFGRFLSLIVPFDVSFLGVNYVIEQHALERGKFVYVYDTAYLGDERHYRLTPVKLLSFNGTATG